MSENYWFNDDAFSAPPQNESTKNNSANDDFLDTFFNPDGDQEASSVGGSKQTNPAFYSQEQTKAQPVASASEINPASILGQQHQSAQVTKNPVSPAVLFKYEDIKSEQKALHLETKKERMLKVHQQLVHQQALSASTGQANTRIASPHASQSAFPMNPSTETFKQASEQQKPNHPVNSNNVVNNMPSMVSSLESSPHSVAGHNSNNPNQFQKPGASTRYVQNSSRSPSEVSLGHTNANTPQFSGIPVQGNPPSIQLNKLPQSQIAQLQFGLFLAVLNDFMSRRGTPITQPPLINGKKINLFFLYILCQKLGGKEKLANSPIDNQPLSQASPWSLIAQKLGIYDGMNLQQDMLKKSKIDEDLKKCYLQYLLPYEQYSSTPDGQKDIQQKRVHFQKHLLARLQQQNGNVLKQEPAVPPSAQHSINMKQSLSPASSLPPNISNAPSVNEQNFGSANNSDLSQAPTPQQRMPSGLSNHSSQNSPAMMIPPGAQQAQTPHVGPVQNNMPVTNNFPPTPPVVHSKPNAASLDNSRQKDNNVVSEKNEPKESTDQVKDVIKNYVPFSRVLETHGGVDLKALSSIGSEIEMTKPVYLFAPELGSVNIHALTMALKNYQGTFGGESFSALNTLLVTTSDSSHTVKASDCPELIDSLGSLGLKVVRDIICEAKFENSEQFETISQLGSKSNIDDVFKRYVPSGNDLMDEDVAFIVDSLTGAVVDEDEFDEIEIDRDHVSREADDMITDSPINENENKSVISNENFHFEDYMTILSTFKQENEYHFSKIQTKCATDNQVLLVDQLITVTMIMRNISFAEANREFLAKNPIVQKLIFKIVRSILLHSEMFLFERKKLCLLKDCLVILDNISYNLDLQSLEETVLSILLVASFGPKLEKGYVIPKAPLHVYSYLPIGIDALAKLIVREPHNRTLFSVVLSGNFCGASASLAASSSNITITKDDENRSMQIALSFLGGDSEALENGGLFVKIFQLLLSVVPAYSNALEVTKLVFSRASVICQSLFASKILLDLIVPDDSLSAVSLVPISLLLNNSTLILSNTMRVGISLVMETAKLPRKSNEQQILTLFLIKLFTFVNSLLAIVSSSQESITDPHISSQIKGLSQLSRVMPNTNQVLDYHLSPTINDGLSKELLRFFFLLRSLS